MAENDLEINLRLDDKASAGLDKAQKKVSGFTQKAGFDFTQLAAKVYLVQQAYRTLTSVVSPMIEASQRQETAISKLNSQLEINGFYTERVSKELQDFAKEIQKVSKFGDEAVIEQTAFALAMGATEGQVKQVIQAAVDMSASLNIDLNAAVRNITKTLGGYAGELGEVIPELKELTQEQLRAGQGVDLLANKFSGAAASEMDDFEFKAIAVKNAWGDFMEQLGDIVTKSKPVLDSLDLIVTKIEELQEVTKIMSKSEDIGNPFTRFIDGAFPALAFVGDLATGYAKAGINARNAAIDIGQFNDVVMNPTEAFQNTAQALETTNRSIQSFGERTSRVSEQADAHIKTTEDLKKKANKEAIKGFFEVASGAAQAQKDGGAALKVIRSSEALINTYAGVNQALASYPPPISWALAAINLAQGLASVAVINSQGFAQGTDSVPSMLSPGEMVIPNTFAQAVRDGRISIGGGGSGEVNIVINNPSFTDEGQVDSIMERIGLEIQSNLRTAR